MRILCVLLMTASLAAQSGDWKVLKSWSGDGTSETESFSTSNREWRLRWQTKDTNPRVPGTFSVSVYSADDDKLVSSASGSGSQESYVRGKGRYYLKVNALLVQWVVRVEEP